jgi:hypothetical protein
MRWPFVFRRREEVEPPVAQAWSGAPTLPLSIHSGPMTLYPGVLTLPDVAGTRPLIGPRPGPVVPADPAAPRGRLAASTGRPAEAAPPTSSWRFPLLRHRATVRHPAPRRGSQAAAAPPPRVPPRVLPVIDRPPAWPSPPPSSSTPPPVRGWPVPDAPPTDRATPSTREVANPFESVPWSRPGTAPEPFEPEPFIPEPFEQAVEEPWDSGDGLAELQAVLEAARGQATSADAGPDRPRSASATPQTNATRRLSLGESRRRGISTRRPPPEPGEHGVETAVEATAERDDDPAEPPAVVSAEPGPALPVAERTLDSATGPYTPPEAGAPLPQPVDQAMSGGGLVAPEPTDRRPGSEPDEVPRIDAVAAASVGSEPEWEPTEPTAISSWPVDPIAVDPIAVDPIAVDPARVDPARVDPVVSDRMTPGPMPVERGALPKRVAPPSPLSRRLGLGEPINRPRPAATRPATDPEPPPAPTMVSAPTTAAPTTAAPTMGSAPTTAAPTTPALAATPPAVAPPAAAISPATDSPPVDSPPSATAAIPVTTPVAALRPVSTPEQAAVSAEVVYRAVRGVRRERPPVELARVVGAAHGVDVADVAVFRGPAVAERARSLGARAFTSAGDVYLPDDTDPLADRVAGAVLVHELTHVAQQHVLGAALPAESTAAGRALEREARSAEQWFLDGATGPPLTHPPVAGALATRPRPASTHVPARRPEPARNEEFASPDLLQRSVDGSLSWTAPQEALDFFSTPAPAPVAQTAAAPQFAAPQFAAPAGSSWSGPVPTGGGIEELARLLDSHDDTSAVDTVADRAVLDRIASEPTAPTVPTRQMSPPPEADREFAACRDRLVQLCAQRPVNLDSVPDMDELATKVYHRVRGLLRWELIVDRERSGLLTDFR